MRVTGRLVLFVSVVPLLLAKGAGAAEESGKQIKLAITSKSPTYNAKTGKATIRVGGKAPALPVSSTVAVILEYNFRQVCETKAVVGPDGTFSGAVLKPEIPLPADNMYELYLRVREEDQAERFKAKVKQFLRKVEYNPFQGRITLGTAAERKAARTELVKYVNAALKGAVAANNRLLDEVEAAEKKEKYQKEGSFDSAAWRTFLDDDWRPGMIKLQKDFYSWLKKNPAYGLRYASGVLYLENLLKVVALRSVLRSRQLYQLMRRKVAAQDARPPQELKTLVKGFTIRTDKKARREVVTYYRAVKDDFRLNPPRKKTPKKKAATPKKKADTGKKSTKKKSSKEKKGS